MQELIGKKVGHYQIKSLLARGGMSEVYLADDLESGQTAAIKLVHTGNTNYCERFRREMQAMASLQHEYILPVLDYGEFESWCYLVTPYIASGTLNTILKQGPLSLEEAGQILDQLTSALQDAHDHGIVHRDIKPSNVLVQDGRHVYLADFGLAKKIGEDSNLTLTGYVLGTPEYMAPELMETDATISSDIYSLGIILYQMVAGRVPFSGSTPLAVCVKHVNEYPAPPSSYNADIPAFVEQVILQAISKDPHDRFQTPRALYNAYQHALLLVEEEKAAIAELTTQDGVRLPLFTLSRNEDDRDLMPALIPTAPQVNVVRQQSSNRRHTLIGLLSICLFAIPVLLSLAFTQSYAAMHGSSGQEGSRALHITTVTATSTSGPTTTSAPTPTATPTPSPTAAPQPASTGAGIYIQTGGASLPYHPAVGSGANKDTNQADTHKKVSGHGHGHGGGD